MLRGFTDWFLIFSAHFIEDRAGSSRWLPAGLFQEAKERREELQRLRHGSGEAKRWKRGEKSEREGMERDGKGGKGQGEGFAWLLQLEMTREDCV